MQIEKKINRIVYYTIVYTTASLSTCTLFFALLHMFNLKGVWSILTLIICATYSAIIISPLKAQLNKWLKLRYNNWLNRHTNQFGKEIKQFMWNHYKFHIE